MLVKPFDIPETLLLLATIDILVQLEWEVRSEYLFIWLCFTLTAFALYASTTVFACIGTWSISSLPDRLLQCQIVLSRMMFQCYEFRCLHYKRRSLLLISNALLYFGP